MATNTCGRLGGGLGGAQAARARCAPAGLVAQPLLAAQARVGKIAGGAMRMPSSLRTGRVVAAVEGSSVGGSSADEGAQGSVQFPAAQALFQGAQVAKEEHNNRRPGRFCEVTADMEDLMPDPDDEDLFDDDYDHEDDLGEDSQVHEFLQYREEEERLQDMAQKMRANAHNRYALTLEVARMAQARRPWQDFDYHASYNAWQEPPKPIVRAIFDMEEEIEGYNARQRLKEIELEKEERDYQFKKEEREISEYQVVSPLMLGEDEEEEEAAEEENGLTRAARAGIGGDGAAAGGAPEEEGAEASDGGTAEEAEEEEAPTVDFTEGDVGELLLGGDGSDGEFDLSGLLDAE